MNLAVYAHCIAEIDSARHVVTAIYIVDVAAVNDHTRCQVTRELRARYVVVDFCDIYIFSRSFVPGHRTHVGHTATAIEVVNHECRGCRNLHEDTVLVNHTASVTAAVEVTYLAALQVPRRADGHVRAVVASEETSYLEGIAAGIREARVDAHIQEAACCQQLSRCIFRSDTSGIGNAVNHLAGVIHMNDCLFSHCGIVTATIGIDDGTALNVEIGLVNLGRIKPYIACRGDFCGDRCGVVSLIIYIMCGLACSWVGRRVIVIFTVTTGKELTEIDLRCRLCITG